MADIVIVGEGLLLENNEVGLCALSLGKAFQEQKHRVFLVTLLSGQEASQNAFLARRLRTVEVQIADEIASCSVFEGSHPRSQLSFFALGIAAKDKGHTAAYLAAATSLLCASKQLTPKLLLAWGEAATPTLRSIAADSKLFVLPDGRWTRPLTETERLALDPHSADLELAQYSLAGLGVISADALIFPSPSSKLEFINSKQFDYRASDLPMLSIRYGSDEQTSNNTMIVPSLPFQAKDGAVYNRNNAKKLCARRAGLSLGTKTLLLATTPLHRNQETIAFCDALKSISKLDIALAISGEGDPELEAIARDYSLENPGKLAILTDHNLFSDQWLLAGADAALIFSSNSASAREAGISLRHGALPIVSDSNAFGDYIVDIDPNSRTGTGLLFSSDTPAEILTAIDRLRHLRADYALWTELQSALINSSPKWSETAQKIGQFKSVFTTAQLQSQQDNR